MDSKTIELKFNGFLSDGGVMGIQDNLSYPIMPYWISNPTGATLRKIKMLIYNIQSFDSLGGSITLKIYSAPVSTYSQQLTRDIVFQEAELINEIAITGDEPVELDYYTDYKIVDTVITEPKFIVAVIDIAGNVIARDAYIWIDYENNPL